MMKATVDIISLPNISVNDKEKNTKPAPLSSIKWYIKSLLTNNFALSLIDKK